MNPACIADIPQSFWLLRDVEIFLEPNNHEKILGGSAFEPVLEVRFRGLKCAGQSLTRRPKDQAWDQTCKEWGRLEEECKILCEVRHPNIVQFLGVYFNKNEMPAPILVSEFLPTNLTSCIEQYGILPNEISYSILHDVALGLCYLHGQTPSIIHRDLHSNNVLLTSNMTAKISDLGKAKILRIGTKLSQLTGSGIKVHFMPPEAMQANPQYNTCINEFSYGIIMIHVFSGQLPEPQCSAVCYDSNLDPDPILLDGEYAVSEAKRREVFLHDIGDDHPLMDLIYKCIDNSPEKRAHASEIVERLAKMVLTSITNRVQMLNDLREKNGWIETLEKENRDLREKLSKLQEENEDLRKGHEILQDPPPKKLCQHGGANSLSQDDESSSSQGSLK